MAGERPSGGTERMSTNQPKDVVEVASHVLFALKYTGVWSCDEYFTVWKSDDGRAIQVTDPNGNVLLLIELKCPPHSSHVYYPVLLAQALAN